MIIELLAAATLATKEVNPHGLRAGSTYYLSNQASLIYRGEDEYVIVTYSNSSSVSQEMVSNREQVFTNVGCNTPSRNYGIIEQGSYEVGNQRYSYRGLESYNCEGYN